MIEHVDDPFAMLAAMESRAAIVMVNLLNEEPDAEHPHHRELPIRGILERAHRRGLLLYRRYHDGRSHLIAYRSARAADTTTRVRSVVQRRLGPLLGRGRDPHRGRRSFA